MRETVDVLGVAVDRVDLSGALDILDGAVNQKEPCMVVTANPEIVMLAKDDPNYAEILRKAGMVTADGIGLVLAAKINGTPVRGRVPGIDLVQGLFKLAERTGYTFYFLGAKQEVVTQAVANVREKYPGINIVGFHNGYFRDCEGQVLADIKAKKPQILLAALGMGFQESWINKHQANLGVPLAVGVGGSFDVFAGAAKRAPLWMQKAGIEWLYRLLKQPSRIGRMLVLPKFLIIVLLRRIGIKA